jgi:hypothetical protein
MNLNTANMTYAPFEQLKENQRIAEVLTWIKTAELPTSLRPVLPIVTFYFAKVAESNNIVISSKSELIADYNKILQTFPRKILEHVNRQFPNSSFSEFVTSIKLYEVNKLLSILDGIEEEELDLLESLVSISELSPEIYFDIIGFSQRYRDVKLDEIQTIPKESDSASGIPQTMRNTISEIIEIEKQLSDAISKIPVAVFPTEILELTKNLHYEVTALNDIFIFNDLGIVKFENDLERFSDDELEKIIWNLKSLDSRTSIIEYLKRVKNTSPKIPTLTKKERMLGLYVLNQVGVRKIFRREKVDFKSKLPYSGIAILPIEDESRLIRNFKSFSKSFIEKCENITLKADERLKYEFDKLAFLAKSLKDKIDYTRMNISGDDVIEYVLSNTKSGLEVYKKLETQIKENELYESNKRHLELLKMRVELFMIKKLEMQVDIHELEEIASTNEYLVIRIPTISPKIKSIEYKTEVERVQIPDDLAKIYNILQTVSV